MPRSISGRTSAQQASGSGSCARRSAPHLDRPVADLTSIDLQRIIDAKATTTSAATANRIRAALVHFAKWCWLRGHLPEHIGAKTTKAGKEKPRDRVLSLDEVRAIYAATFDLLPVWGATYRLPDP